MFEELMHVCGEMMANEGFDPQQMMKMMFEKIKKVENENRNF